jgi:hypothetical protein
MLSHAASAPPAAANAEATFSAPGFRVIASSTFGHSRYGFSREARSRVPPPETSARRATSS